MTGPSSRAACAALDAVDRLAALRSRFLLPEGIVYLDGNSLGPLPASVPAALEAMVRDEWGSGLVRSWNLAGWWQKPCSLGAEIAPLIGADRDEVVACDSTSINLFKVLAAALEMAPDRRVVVAERNAFPTDLYMAASVAELLADRELRLVDTSAGGPSTRRSGATELDAALDGSVAVVLLSHVDYRSSAMHDMRAVTERIHRSGALAIWDLAHSVGAVPLEVTGCGVDFAVGCTYKYLSGGPGSPAFLYAARRHHGSAHQPLTGWHGHAEPFLFRPEYEPAPGMRRFLVGSPPLISFASLEAALAIWRDVDLDAVLDKSHALSGLLIDLVGTRCPELRLGSPRDPTRRGSHVALHHEHAYDVVQALAKRGVVGDFREPDVVRLALAPLYLSFVELWDAVEILVAVLDDAPWASAPPSPRAPVT